MKTEKWPKAVDSSLIARNKLQIQYKIDNSLKIISKQEC